MTLRKVLDVLLVEDDPGDSELVNAALGDSRGMLNLNVVEDGEKAIAYLRRKAPYGDAPRPDIVVLDLNLPRKDGREVLDEMKRDPGLRDIPVVVFTTSAAEEDVFRAYASGANFFVTKPLGYPEFVRVIGAINSLLFSTARLPSKGRLVAGRDDSFVPAKTEAIKVLDVDDDEGDYILTRELLRRSGGLYDVTWAPSVAKAAEAMGRTTFDVILLDLRLPDARGLASLEPIFCRPPRTALVVLSGLEDDRTGKELLKRGAQAYISKACLTMDPSDLVAVIRCAMEKARHANDA